MARRVTRAGAHGFCNQQMPGRNGGLHAGRHHALTHATPPHTHTRAHTFSTAQLAKDVFTEVLGGKES